MQIFIEVATINSGRICEVIRYRYWKMHEELNMEICHDLSSAIKQIISFDLLKNNGTIKIKSG